MSPELNIAVPKPAVTNRYKKYLVYAFPVGAGIALFILVLLIFVPGISPISTLLPTASDLSSHNDQINQQAARVTRMQQKINVLSQIDQNQLTAILAKTEDAIPDDKNVAETLAVIGQIATAAGTTVTSSSLLPSGTAGTDKSTVQYQTSLRGSYPAVKDFLTKLENAKRIMTVKSVNISVADNGNVTADMILNSYFTPLPQVSSDDSPLAQISSTQQKLLSQLDSRTNYPSPTPATNSAGRADPFAGF